MRFARILALAALVSAVAVPAFADEALTVDGLVKQPLHFSAADLAALPQTIVHVTVQTGHGPEEADFAGPSVMSLLEKAGLSDELGNRKTRSSHYIVASGSDGYQAVIALGEIDPELEGKAVVVALTRDGKPLEARQGLKLAVPGDKHGARSVYQLTHLELK